MEGTPLVAAWALARDILARPEGKAGYLSIAHAAATSPIDNVEYDPYDRWLVIDLPLFGALLQVSYAVTTEFMSRWPLPPYIGARVAVPNNENALQMYGGFIAAERAVTGNDGGKQGQGGDLIDRATRSLDLSPAERSKVKGRREATGPRRGIGIVKKGGEPERPEQPKRPAAEKAAD